MDDEETNLPCIDKRGCRKEAQRDLKSKSVSGFYLHFGTADDFYATL